MKNQPDKTKTKHHYVPQVFLKGFASSNKKKDEPLIWMYQKEGTSPIEDLISNVAAVRGLYATQLVGEKKKSDIVENLFADMESDIEKELGMLKKLDFDKIGDVEREKLDYFFSVLSIRTPKYFRQQNTIASDLDKELLQTGASNKANFYRDLEKSTGITDIEQAEDIRQKALNFDKYFRIKYPRTSSGVVRMALMGSLTILPCFRMKTMQIARASGKSVFVLSDSPVVLIPQDYIYGKGFLHSTILIPITPTLCLVFTNEPMRNRIFGVSDSIVGKINKCSIALSHRFIFANIKSMKIQGALENNEYFDKEDVELTKFGVSGDQLIITTPKTAPYKHSDIFSS